MGIFLIAMGVVALGGLGSLLLARSPRRASVVGAAGAASGCALGLVPAIGALLGAPIESVSLAWNIPGGAFSVSLDAVSGLFLVPTLLLSLLAASFGVEYLDGFGKAKSLGTAWCCFNLLVVSMGVVLVARNGVLFLLAWETMALASFFLVTFEHERTDVREAGWTYLIATHLGTAFLLAMFVLMASAMGSFEFEAFTRVQTAAPALTGLLFILAVIGFGTKAGFVPLHAWLPEAHPTAPSHVSAVMSGVMIKTGIYGLVRLLMLFGPPPLWWGWLLIAIGVTSGVLGVLFALAQHDLKRLLAYHSVENIGIIGLGIGLGTLGIATGTPALAILGYGGGLLHVLNHALFKGLLFLGAGSVLHSAGTRDIDQLGGLLRRMPWTGPSFLVGATAISGLPPLNGFVSEFLIYLGAFGSVARSPGAVMPVIPCLIAIGALALIGGLATACFTKAFGIVFLGEPRSEHAAHAHEVGLLMRLPMALLAAACIGVGLFPFAVVRALTPGLLLVTRQPEPTVTAVLAGSGDLLRMIALGAAIFLICVVCLAILRRRLLAGRPVEETVTWDCGYVRPTARMQYTASSFAQPLTQLFRMVLRTRTRMVPPEGFFPRRASLTTDTPDSFRESVFHPAFAGIERAFDRLRILQQGRIQLYVLYIVLTLIGLMVWKLG
jgi:hydrogenase-4 component B